MKSKQSSMICSMNTILVSTEHAKKNCYHNEKLMVLHGLVLVCLLLSTQMTYKAIGQAEELQS